MLKVSKAESAGNINGLPKVSVTDYTIDIHTRYQEQVCSICMDSKNETEQGAGGAAHSMPAPLSKLPKVK